MIGSSEDCITKIKENAISKCSICLDHYSKLKRVPVAIPCGHSFCRLCISSICKGRMIKCPICREVSIFAFGQLGKNVALWETLDLLNLLEEDDEEEQFADFPDYDTAKFDETDVQSLDPDVVRPFVKFFMTFLRHFYSSKVEELNLLTQFYRVWQQNLDLATIRQEGLNYWQSFSRTLDMFVDRCDSFTEALSRWNRNSPLAVITDNSNRDEPFYDYNGVGEMVLSILDPNGPIIYEANGNDDPNVPNEPGPGSLHIPAVSPDSTYSPYRGRGRSSYRSYPNNRGPGSYLNRNMNDNHRLTSNSNNREMAENLVNRGRGGVIYVPPRTRRFVFPRR